MKHTNGKNGNSGEERKDDRKNRMRLELQVQMNAMIPGRPGIASVIAAQIAPNGQACGGYWCPSWRVVVLRSGHWMLVGLDAVERIRIVIPHNRFAQWVACSKPPKAAGVFVIGAGR